MPPVSRIPSPKRLRSAGRGRSRAGGEPSSDDAGSKPGLAAPSGSPDPQAPTCGWWLFVHQLPPAPPGLRVKVWRRLRALGALQIKGSIYVLPALDSNLEDLQWLARDIHAAGADASIWRACAVEGYSDQDLIRRFQEQSTAEYEELEAEARNVLAGLREPSPPSSPRSPDLNRQMARLRARFQELGEREHFQAPRREVVGALLDKMLAQLEGRAMKSSAPPLDAGDFRGKLWVTRATVYADRIACAWLIRRFIDPQARFTFVTDSRNRSDAAADVVRFDMYEGEFTHEGDRCSFEVMLERFGLDDPGLRALAEIVHDIDVKDDKYGRPETAGIAAVLQGICRADADDPTRLARGTELFDDLYRRFGEKRR